MAVSRVVSGAMLAGSSGEIAVPAPRPAAAWTPEMWFSTAAAPRATVAERAAGRTKRRVAATNDLVDEGTGETPFCCMGAVAGGISGSRFRGRTESPREQALNLHEDPASWGAQGCVPDRDDLWGVRRCLESCRFYPKEDGDEAKGRGWPHGRLFGRGPPRGSEIAEGARRRLCPWGDAAPGRTAEGCFARKVLTERSCGRNACPSTQGRRAEGGGLLWQNGFHQRGPEIVGIAEWHRHGKRGERSCALSGCCCRAEDGRRNRGKVDELRGTREEGRSAGQARADDAHGETWPQAT